MSRTLGRIIGMELVIGAAVVVATGIIGTSGFGWVCGHWIG